MQMIVSACADPFHC